MPIKRVWHPWTSWECYPAGMHESAAAGMTTEQAMEAYRAFLADISRFQAAMVRVGNEWPYSAEHNLTNEGINRVAWLGQSAMCIETGVPCCFRAGFKLLTDEQQCAANKAAEDYLNEWLVQYEAKGCRLPQDMGRAWLRWRDTGRGAGFAHTSRPGAVLQGNLFGAAFQ